MTVSSIARRHPAAGPNPDKNRHMRTVTSQQLTHVLDCIASGDVRLTSHRYTTIGGADIDTAVYTAEDRGYATFDGNGWPQLTQAGKQWLAGQPPAPSAPLFIAPPEQVA